MIKELKLLDRELSLTIDSLVGVQHYGLKRYLIEERNKVRNEMKRISLMRRFIYAIRHWRFYIIRASGWGYETCHNPNSKWWHLGPVNFIIYF